MTTPTINGGHRWSYSNKFFDLLENRQQVPNTVYLAEPASEVNRCLVSRLTRLHTAIKTLSVLIMVVINIFDNIK